MKKEDNNKKDLTEKSSLLNNLIGWLSVLIMLAGIVWIIKTLLFGLYSGIEMLVLYLRKFVSTTDTVIVVAMITGAVSIIGVVISSIVAKVLDYRYNVKKYLFDKREKPYEDFINMIYAIMEDTQKPPKERLSEEELTKMVSEFSKGLTLWGSNRVVKKWLRYRRNSIKGGNENVLILLEDIIYEIRRDVGLKKRLKKGDMLSFFINDIENITKK